MENIEDKNPPDSIGWTPFHEAAENGRLEVCQLIINNIEDKNPPLLINNIEGDVDIWSYAIYGLPVVSIATVAGLYFILNPYLKHILLNEKSHVY